MSDDLQQKINTWWGNLSEEEREQWWSNHDYVHFEYDDGKCSGNGLLNLGLSSDTHFVFFDIRHTVNRKYCAPAACGQFWWKLEAWLGNRLLSYERNERRSTYETSHRYETKIGVYNKTDRRQALIDAAIAV